MARLAGKRAFVTGAGSGIGLAVCRRFVAEGAMVVAADIAGLDRAAAIDSQRVVACHCDVTDPAAVEAAIDLCQERMGGLDILFNNAGIGRGGTRLHEVSIKDWDDVIAVNVRGPFLVLKYALPLMMQSGGGSVINTASTSSYQAVARTGAYSASKGAVAQLTAMAAIEYAGDGIRVNGIAPGPTDTTLFETLPPAERVAMASALPLGRLGTADEVANVVLFLASEESSFVTGAIYVVDGGKLVGRSR